MRPARTRERNKAPRRSREAVFGLLVRGILLFCLPSTLIWVIGSPCQSWAKPPAVVRLTAGEHPYFGRIVLDAPGLSYTVNRGGGHVLIGFSDDPIFGELPETPRNVLAIRAVPGGVELTVPPGANVRTSQMGSKLIVDIDDTVPNRPPPAALTDARDPAKPARRGAAAKNAESIAKSAGYLPDSKSARPVSGTLESRPPGNSGLADATPVDPSRGNAPTMGAVPASPPPGNAPPARDATRGSVAAANTAPAQPPRGTPSPGTAALDGKGPDGKGPDGKGPDGKADGKPPDGKPADGKAAGLNAPGDKAAGDKVAFAVVAEIAAFGPEGAKIAPPSPATTTRLAPPPPGRTSGPDAPTKANPPPEVPPARDAAAPEDDQAQVTSGPMPSRQMTSPTGGPREPSPDAAPDGPTDAPPKGQQEARTDTSLPGRGDAIQVWPVMRDAIPTGPVALLAVKGLPPAGVGGVAVRFPFVGAVGAALFYRGPDIVVVFDERRPIDLAALRDDPVFASAVVTVYPAATVIRLTRPPNQSAMLFPAQVGWRLSIVAASPAPTAIAQQIANNVMTFPAEAPGQVVAIADPRTGGTLLVGTQRVSGQGVLVERRTPEFILPVTGQGIVVEPQSDAISLALTKAGFVLSGLPGGLALSPAQPAAEATMAAARLTRMFEFPRQTTETLAWRAKQQAVAAAVSPLLTRGPKRHAAAESMLGLGRGAEAQTLLRVTMKDDPREAASPATVGLAAIAALLAGRLQDAGELADPHLTGSDEVALWRAIQTAMADEESPAAAAVFATTAPLLFTYPDELRRRFLALALETMILGGQADAAAPLLAQRADDPRLAYARALLKQAQGDNDAALTLLDGVADTRSMLDHARASVRATELRLTMGQLDNKAAADALEARLYAWRGDRRELALRLRIAELRGKDGAWRAVFAMLRGARADFPGQAAEIDRRLQQAFAAVPRDPSLGKMAPTELIAMLDENAELMANGPDGQPMRALLAEKLMALDLPKQADALLTKLMRAAPFGPARAGFGATLATLRLGEGDADAAILALSESNSADMGDAVRQRRALIIARVEAKRGDPRGAAESLAGDRTPEADEARAAIFEQAKDWPSARDALATLASRVVPDTGVLDARQLQVVLRLATAATRADDDTTLASLREKLRGRIGTGPQADLFRVLTAAPVRGTADLGRARTEIGFARAVAADLLAKKPAARTP